MPSAAMSIATDLVNGFCLLGELIDDSLEFGFRSRILVGEVSVIWTWSKVP